jgi:putative ABC transport system ATP-binding protein
MKEYIKANGYRSGVNRWIMITRTTLLNIVNIEKYYGNKKQVTKAIDTISFQVAAGEFIGVMGASGSGKTTLLNAIATIDQVSAGHIYLNNTDITEISERDIAKFRRQNLGFIFQDFNLLDTLTIQENIALALTINQVDADAIDKQVQMVALQLGIGDILSKFPYEVSGGQKQRCACARAIVTKPQLILADEPTGALDSKSAQMLLESISEMNTKLGATILMVTHDVFAASYCSRILFLKDGTLFNELIKREKTRKQFFNEILDVMALLGGDLSDVL